MAPHAQDLPFALQRRPFHVHDALNRGVSRSRLRAQDLTRPVRGVRMAADEVSLEGRCRALLLHRPERMAFSHVTAAALYGAPLPMRVEAESDLHVTVPAGGRAPQIGGVRSHVLAAWRSCTVNGLPVTTPEQTWLDLAPILGQVALVAVGDFFVSGRDPSTDVVRLAEHLGASSGRRGVARARLAIGRIRAGSESAGETRLRLLLADSGLPEPEVNLDLHDSHGAFVARIDLAYPDARLALEYEGDIHRTDRGVWHRDITRRERIEDLGWRMVRITSADLASPNELIRRIRRHLRTRES